LRKLPIAMLSTTKCDHRDGFILGANTVGNNMDVIKEVKSQLSSKFDMKDLGVANFILGMEIKRDHANMKLWLNQRKYIETIL
jgi:hypothetical protein